MYVKGIDCRTQLYGYDGSQGPHILDERLGTRTSIGLRNVTETSTGPISKVKMVRVGVMKDPVIFE
jgi:hypothetical protein